MAQRKPIPPQTRLRLFASAAGHCQNPNCLDALFPIEMGGDKHIAEMAHVIPHGDAGPRSEEMPVGEFDRDSFENMILLCPTCHTKIDKDDKSYPRSVLLGWKQNHVANLALKQGVKKYENRGDLRTNIVRLLTENMAIWKKYAPIDGSKFEYDPEAGAACVWSHRIRSVILPNHYRIQAMIEANLDLATDEERRIFAEYKEHVRGLSERHVCGVAGHAIRFPEAMDGIFS